MTAPTQSPASTRVAEARVPTRIVVDRIGCDGRGLCAELLPERIALDEWGYPILDPAPLTAGLLGPAKRAVALCPRLALRLAEA